MGEDAGVDRTWLLYLFARREILVDPVHPDRARVVERDQNVLGWDVGAHVNGAGRQPYRLAMLLQRAACRIDRKRGDVMVGALRAIARRAAAACNVEIASSSVRPGILDRGRQRD